MYFFVLIAFEKSFKRFFKEEGKKYNDFKYQSRYLLEDVVDQFESPKLEAW